MTCRWSEGRERIWPSSRESSVMVLEGGARFGSTLALPASQGLDGAAVFGWRLFNGVTYVWIDVVLTGFGLGDGDMGEAVRIWIGVGPMGTLFSGLEPEWTIGFLSWSSAGVPDLTGLFCSLFWSLPVKARPLAAKSDRLEFLGTHYSVAFLSLSLLMRFACALIYFYCTRTISEGWFVCSSQVMGTDQLGWVCAEGGGPAVVILPAQGWFVIFSQAMATDQLVWVCAKGGGPGVVILPAAMATDQLGWVCAKGGDPMVVILPVSWCWVVCRRGIVMSGLSAVWFLLYFSSGSFKNAYSRGIMLLGVCPYGTTCALSAIGIWHTTIKWLLPPGVKMKRKTIKLYFNVCLLLGSSLILISFVGLCTSVRVSGLDIARSLHFILISVVSFRQATCYLYKLNRVSCFFLDYFSLRVFRLIGVCLDWCSLGILTAYGRWNFCLLKWKLPPSGKMKCVDGISVRQHRRKVILSDLLSHSGGFSLLICRHYIQAIEDAICALLAIWCLLEYLVVIETTDFISDCSHCNMGFRLYVPPLYSAVSLLDGF